MTAVRRFAARARIISVPAVLLLWTSCAGHQQSVVDPAGEGSDHIARLWWFFFYLLGAIFLVVMLAMLRTLSPRRSSGEKDRELEQTHLPSEATESTLHRVVTGAIVATVLILFVLLISSVRTGKAVSTFGDRRDPLILDVIANQWWWQFRYSASDPSRTLITADEIHIPVGRPVLIRGQSNDVIHSFWVPNLNGKRDLIPSRLTTEWLEADQPGIYRGQCAEFCGLQHAHMSFYVVAEPPDKFNQWMTAQLQSAAFPADPVLAQGQKVFLSYACVYCHQIRGTAAAGQVAPDLTHFGSRRSIAAGTLPNTPADLSRWILDPQGIKPGNHMAMLPVKPEDLQPLVAYLESLK